MQHNMMSPKKTKAGWVALAVIAAGVAAFAETARVTGEAVSPVGVAAPVAGNGRMQSLSVPAATPDAEGSTAPRPVTSAGPPRMRALSVPAPMREADGAPAIVDADPVPIAPSVNGRSRASVASATGRPLNSNGTAPQSGGPVSVTQIGSGAQGRQSLTLRAATGTFNQRQEGGGNTQILNVESAAGGTVTQRQSGSGNYQSMNVGVTDQRPGVVSGISIQ